MTLREVVLHEYMTKLAYIYSDIISHVLQKHNVMYYREIEETMGEDTDTLIPGKYDGDMGWKGCHTVPMGCKVCHIDAHGMYSVPHLYP